jgi:dihydrofolate reductase
LATGGNVNRILLTRVLSPAFEDCDTFLADFEKTGEWERASHEELQAWVGFDVPKGLQEEKGVQYEFQMWSREGSRMV